MDALEQFYNSTAWRELSHRLKVERSGVCNRCKRQYHDTALLVGHHTEELTLDNVHNPAVSLNPQKIEVICFDCHNREHRRFGYKRSIHIVWGSPFSGKRKYVRDHIIPGDLVVDIDAIWTAVTYMPEDTKPDNCRFNVFAVRRLLIDQVKTRYGNWCDAYIIGGFPMFNEREQLSKELGAERIYCESTEGECMRRMKEAGKPPVFADYIADWWEKYRRNGNAHPPVD
ncbi:MAG: hypothetical protein ACK5LX_07625 [Oscillospiraceae bacterium]